MLGLCFHQPLYPLNTSASGKSRLTNYFLATRIERQTKQVCSWKAKCSSHIPRAHLLPPGPALSLCAIASTLPIIPNVLRNAPASFFFAAILSNFGFLPIDSPIYSRIFDLAPYGISLLLFQGNANSSLSKHPLTSCSPRLLLAFLVGAFGTTLGALLTASALRIPHFALLAAAFTATYVGGSMNFIAVAKALDIPTYVTTAAMAADILAMAAYFTVLFAIASRTQSTDVSSKSVERETIEMRGKLLFKQVLSVPIPIAATVSLTLLAKKVVQLLSLPYHMELLFVSFSSVLISFIPSVSRHLRGASFAATICLNFFFAALGSAARLSTAFSVSWQISLFCVAVLFVHAIIMLLVARYMLRIPLYEILVASNANVGGASTAAAFAASTGGKNLVAGAVAVGTLGYLLGTPLGLCVYHILSR